MHQLFGVTAIENRSNAEISCHGTHFNVWDMFNHATLDLDAWCQPVKGIILLVNGDEKNENKSNRREWRDCLLFLLEK